MKVGIFSHCTMDTIVYENEQYEKSQKEAERQAKINRR